MCWGPGCRCLAARPAEQGVQRCPAAAALGACAVCQQPQEAGARVCFLPCAHAFHSHCIDRWLREYKPECPLCRARVRAPPPRPAPQVVCLYLDEDAGAVLR
jgi:hypothetical protein